jgi:HEAT repeat protein
MTETPTTTDDSTAAGEPERQSTPFLVLQFFIFPMAIVAVCVTVFVVFGLISAEKKTPRAYLAEVRSGGGMFDIRRWQAAFSLANALQSQKDVARKDPGFGDEIVKLYDESAADDPRVQRYLALSMGRLGDARAVPSLRKTVAGAGPGADSETVIYAAWALGTIGDPSAVPDLAQLATHDDRGIRKAAIHALGAFAGVDARSALARALGDAADDVRWNAALALARHGDASATPVLLQMMDRASLAKVEIPTPDRGKEHLSPAQMDDAVLQAVTASAALTDPSLRPVLEGLKANDPSLKVREAARTALEAKRPS